MQMEDHRPVLIVIAGPNGSGKTSITSEILKHEWMENSEYINPDEIAEKRFGGWNNEEAIKKSIQYCEQLREACLEERRSLIFETVLSREDKLDYIYRAKKAGYFIRLFFICLKNPTINASRIAQRVIEGGHDVPIPKIIDRYKKSIANCNVASYIADRTYVFDNSEDNKKAKLLFRLKEGKIAKTYVSKIPEWTFPIYKRRTL